MPTDPTLTAKTLPLWAQVTSFGLAVLAFCGTAYIGISEYFKSADLETKLTKDTFYRLIDRGEAFFCRVTLIAHNGPVLLRDVSVSLLKTEEATKTFPLRVEQFGTLVLKPEKLFQDFNYYGRSTLHYLAEDNPERLVYFCIHQTNEYVANQCAAVGAFEADAQRTRRANQADVGNAADLTADDRALVEQLINRHLQAMLGQIQIEPGAYKLTIRFLYESTAAHLRRWRRPKTSEASLIFTIPANFREVIHRDLAKTLEQRALVVLFGIKQEIAYPTLTPEGYVEC